MKSESLYVITTSTTKLGAVLAVSTKYKKHKYKDYKSIWDDVANSRLEQNPIAHKDTTAHVGIYCTVSNCTEGVSWHVPWQKLDKNFGLVWLSLLWCFCIFSTVGTCCRRSTFFRVRDSCWSPGQVLQFPVFSIVLLCSWKTTHRGNIYTLSTPG